MPPGPTYGDTPVFECRNQSNFTCFTMKFHYCHYVIQGYGREDLLSKTCNREIRNNITLQPNQCHFLHNFDPYLKLGPFQLEVYTKIPYRVVFHDFLSQKEIDHMIEISLPNLSRDR